MKIRCLIIEDESPAQAVIEEFINRLDYLELVGKCFNSLEAINFLHNNEVDLLFLDINMPGMKGTEFYRSLNQKPAVIFTTAYTEYAVEGFELNALDYLLKPISFDRFLQAVNRVTLQSKKAQKAPEATDNGNYDNAFIFVNCDKKMVKVKLKNILYIESVKNYIKIKTTIKELKTYYKISDMAKELPTDKFLQIHRSFIIAKDKVDAYTTTFVEIGDEKITIGKNYREEFAEKFK